MNDIYTKDAVILLADLIRTPSFSGEEADTADLLESFLNTVAIATNRLNHNIYAFSPSINPAKPTLLLNSHHDTVKPSGGWNGDPFTMDNRDGKLYGLGSNDAGAPLVCLIAAFRHFYLRENLNHNLVLALTGEEENSGPNGLRALLPVLGKIDLAIVGEPTGMEMATAEKGLIVLRCQAKGRSGHAARDTGENAISNAVRDIQWLHSYQFPNVSEMLGPVKMTVTMISAGTQHNVIPDHCNYTIDIRTTDTANNALVLETIKANIDAEITGPNLNLNASVIPLDHPLVTTAKSLGVRCFGSPTLSDQSLISAPSVKMGPGRSERSHTANEYVYISEIHQGIRGYIDLLEHFLKT